jgi:hypothetical protein
MSKGGIEAFADPTTIEQAQRASTIAILTTWFLAVALGVVFWTLLLPDIVVPVVVRVIHVGQ